MGVSDQHHAPAALYSWEMNRGTLWIEESVDMRAGLDTEARAKIVYLCRELNSFVQSVARHYTD
jgi:hypothetical protein